MASLWSHQSPSSSSSFYSMAFLNSNIFFMYNLLCRPPKMSVVLEGFYTNMSLKNKFVVISSPSCFISQRVRQDFSKIWQNWKKKETKRKNLHCQKRGKGKKNRFDDYCEGSDNHNEKEQQPKKKTKVVYMGFLKTIQTCF